MLRQLHSDLTKSVTTHVYGGSGLAEERHGARKRPEEEDHVQMPFSAYVYQPQLNVPAQSNGVKVHLAMDGYCRDAGLALG